MPIILNHSPVGVAAQMASNIGRHREEEEKRRRMSSAASSINSVLDSQQRDRQFQQELDYKYDALDATRDYRSQSLDQRGQIASGRESGLDQRQLRQFQARRDELTLKLDAGTATLRERLEHADLQKALDRASREGMNDADNRAAMDRTTLVQDRADGRQERDIAADAARHKDALEHRTRLDEVKRGDRMSDQEFRLRQKNLDNLAADARQRLSQLNGRYQRAYGDERKRILAEFNEVQEELDGFRGLQNDLAMEYDRLRRQPGLGQGAGGAMPSAMPGADASPVFGPLGPPPPGSLNDGPPVASSPQRQSSLIGSFDDPSVTGTSPVLPGGFGLTPQTMPPIGPDASMSPMSSPMGGGMGGMPGGMQGGIPAAAPAAVAMQVRRQVLTSMPGASPEMLRAAFEAKLRQLGFDPSQGVQ